MKTRVTSATSLIVLGSAVFGGCIVSPGDRAPDWALRDINHRERHLSDYAGKVVVMDFWATWCSPCRLVSPHMQALQEKYGDKGLVVIGVHYNDQGDPAGYMKKHGYTFVSMMDGYEVAREYGVSKIPTMIIVSRDGKVVHRQTGFATADASKLEAIVECELRKASRETG